MTYVIIKNTFGHPIVERGIEDIAIAISKVTEYEKEFGKGSYKFEVEQ